MSQFYVAVYDGHGGRATAEIVKEKLHVVRSDLSI